MLVDPTGETILKPMDDVEFEFYEVIKQYAEIKSYFPKFFGRKVIEDETGVVSHYVQIENLTFGFEQPCICDLKIGFRGFDLKQTLEIHKFTNFFFVEVTTTVQEN